MSPTVPAREPPSRKGVVLVGLLGVLVGLGIFTFGYAKGTSYLSNDPNTCINCHIMRDEFEAWNHSSHKAFATCNDCHTPHRFPDKWLVKGMNGFRHSLAFTLDNYKEPLQITAFNAEIAQENCERCHQEMISMITAFHQSGKPDDKLKCIACHGNVGHGNKPGS